jgi:DNA-binding NtrC family response regulator
MNESTILLISRDLPLIEEVRDLAHDVENLVVAVMGGLDETYAFTDWDRVALVLIHHDRRSTTNGVLRLLRMIAAARRLVATVVLADGPDESEINDLLRLGVADLLPRPFDQGRLSYLIEVLTLRARQPVVTKDEPGLAGGGTDWDESDAMVAQARRVASQDATVLISGEVGTGKSRLARAIHDLSPRRRGPFATIRCAGTSAESFADELFGGPRGSGPDPSPGGKLAAAREGTLVLDDVDALAPMAQAALLAWIEDDAREASARPQSRPSRPRIIAATRESLGDLVVEGRFRSDLFYRLNVIGLQLPPLRQRRLEITPLATELLVEIGGESAALGGDAFQAIEAYNWPGNVRELREALETALASARGSQIDRDHLPEAVRSTTLWPRSQSPVATDDVARMAATTLAQTKREAEYARITEALEKHGHNRLRTASELGISRMTLYKKLYKYGIIEQEGREGRLPAGRPRRDPVSPT